VVPGAFEPVCMFDCHVGAHLRELHMAADLSQ
jgi:hypothetical protein